jgi:glycosyltransferase involved in cell wall biosynthesis
LSLSATTLPTKFYIFDTHPVQYRSPMFVRLHEKLPQLKVFFYDEKFDGSKWWFNEVNKIPPQKWELELTAGFPNQFLTVSQSGLWKFFATVREILRQGRPDAVLVYGYYLPENWIVWLACLIKKIPVLFIGETIWLGSGWRRRLKQLVLPIFFRGVRRIVTLGVRNEEFYVSLGIPRRKLTTGKYSINLNFFQKTPVDAAATRKRLRQELGIPETAFVILFVGRLFYRKRPLDMLTLHQRLKDLPNVYTVMIGNGEQEGELKERAKGEERVRLVGFKNQGETRDHYYLSDLLLVPSEFEFWPTVVSEAFVRGITAIVTESCAVAGDLVLHDETGYIFKTGDLDSAERFARKVITDPAERKRLSENAQRKVLSAYGTEHFVESLARALREIKEV